jgi:hypothetical protein
MAIVELLPPVRNRKYYPKMTPGEFAASSSELLQLEQQINFSPETKFSISSLRYGFLRFESLS